jgi:uncharacterized protein YkwD
LVCLLGTLAFGASASPASALSSKQLLAPTSVCRGQLSATTTPDVQERIMRCMINYARQRNGAIRLKPSGRLDHSSLLKSIDILRCQVFEHTACGRDFTYWIGQLGYLLGCWHVGENLAWGNGKHGTVRAIMLAWLNSPDHRENLLDPQYRQIGLGLRIGDFGVYHGAHVWTTHFGVHC